MKVATLNGFVTKALDTIHERIAANAADIKTLHDEHQTRIKTLKNEQRELVHYAKTFRKLAPDYTPTKKTADGAKTNGKAAHAAPVVIERGDIQRRVLLTVERLKTPSTEAVSKAIHHPMKNTYQALHRLMRLKEVTRIKPNKPTDPVKWKRA